MMNDDQDNFNNTTRYCLGRDSQPLEGIPLRHLRNQARNGGKHSINVEIGIIV